MAVRRLINMIEGLAVNKDAQSIRGDRQFDVNTETTKQDFLFRGRVESIGQNVCSVSTPDGTSQAVMATDEPLQVGQPVWVCRSDAGEFIVLGSISGA